MEMSKKSKNEKKITAATLWKNIGISSISNTKLLIIFFKVVQKKGKI